MRSTRRFSAPLAVFLCVTACQKTAEKSEPEAAPAPAPEAAKPAEPLAPPKPEPIVLKPVQKGEGPTSTAKQEMTDRGKMLVMNGSCNDCHTPWLWNEALQAPAPDMSRMLSGHPEGAPEVEGALGMGDNAIIGPTFTAFALPFGTVYAANLTPDNETGTGTWTEKMFVDIFRKGRHLGGDGRPVYPPMPWMMIRALTDKDLKAIFAYLRSVPALKNAVPEPKIPPEAVAGLTEATKRIIKLQKNPKAKLPKMEGPPAPPPIELAAAVPGSASPTEKKYTKKQIEIGRQLLTAGSCHDCHTPWKWYPELGGPAPDFSRALQGHPADAPDPVGKHTGRDIAVIGPTFTSFALPFGIVYSANITPDDETGLGKVTEQQFIDILRNGKHHTGRALLPPMPWPNIRADDDESLIAIFAYLRTVPPIKNQVPAHKIPAGVIDVVAKQNTAFLNTAH